MSVSLHPLSHRKQFEMMNRDVAQLVSAPALGAGGPAFESQYPDKIKGVTKSCDSFFYFSITSLFFEIGLKFNNFVSYSPGKRANCKNEVFKVFCTYVSTLYGCIP